MPLCSSQRPTLREASIALSMIPELAKAFGNHDASHMPSDTTIGRGEKGRLLGFTSTHHYSSSDAYTSRLAQGTFWGLISNYLPPG